MFSVTPNAEFAVHEVCKRSEGKLAVDLISILELVRMSACRGTPAMSSSVRERKHLNSFFSNTSHHCERLSDGVRTWMHACSMSLVDQRIIDAVARLVLDSSHELSSSVLGVRVYWRTAIGGSGDH